MDEIRELLDAVSDRESRNRLTLANVKTWLAEYADARSEDVQRFGDESSSRHWDMVVADYDPSEDAQFLAVFFCDDHVSFLAGRGPAGEVKRFADSTFPAAASDVLDELSSKFASGTRWTTSASEVIIWART